MFINKRLKTLNCRLNVYFFLLLPFSLLLPVKQLESAILFISRYFVLDV